MAESNYLRYKLGNNNKAVEASVDNPYPVRAVSGGHEQFITAFGDAYVGERIADLLVQFQYSNSDKDVAAIVTGTGTTAHNINMAEVHSGTGVGSAVIRSRIAARYLPGHEMYGSGTAIFTTPEAGTKQLYGLLDDEHGFALGFDGLEFSCTVRNNSTDDFTKAIFLDRLDGKGPSQFNMDPTKLNVFRITYGWHGLIPTLFWVYGGHLLGWVLFAYIDLIGTNTTPSTENPSISMRMEVSRAAGTGADMIIGCGSWAAGSITSEVSNTIGARDFAFENFKTVAAGVLTNIFTLRAEAAFLTKESHILSDLIFASAALDGTKTGSVKIFKNATLGGTPIWNSIDAANSTVSVDVAGTTVSGGEFEMGIVLGKVDSRALSLLKQGIRMSPGDTLTFAGLSPNAGDFQASTRWRELF